MDNLDLKKATEMCRSNEIANAQVKDVQGNNDNKIDALRKLKNKNRISNSQNEQLENTKCDKFGCG